LDKSVLYVPIPELGNHRFILTVTRGNTVFARPQVYGIDSLQYVMTDDRRSVIAYRGLDPAGETVVEISAPAVYTLVRSSLMGAMTLIEAEARERAEVKAIESAFPPEAAGHAPTIGGQYL
jgi:hypothetical protein